MKEIVFLILKATFAVGLLLLLMRHSLLQADLINNCLQKPLLALLVIGIFILMVLLNTWRWYRLNHAQKINMSFRHTIMPTYIGIAFNNILPGSVGGDFVRLYAVLKKINCSKSKVILSVFCDRLLGLMGIFCMIGLMAVCQINLFNSHHALHHLCFAGLVLSSGCIGFLLIPASTLDRILARMGEGAWLSQRNTEKFWVKTVLSLLEAVHIYCRKKLVILESIIISVMIQALMVGATMLIAYILQLPSITIVSYAIALAMTQLVNLIPIAPGGLGVGEIAFANSVLLLNPGVIAPFATVFLCYRLFGIISYLPAIFYYLINFKLLRTSAIT